MKRIAVLVAVLAVALPTAAHAVWGGQEDTAHPGVGAMYFDFMGTGTPVADGLICSGSYAGPSRDGPATRRTGRLPGSQRKATRVGGSARPPFRRRSASRRTR